jgi:hypothetical protein
MHAGHVLSSLTSATAGLPLSPPPTPALLYTAISSVAAAAAAGSKFPAVSSGLAAAAAAKTATAGQRNNTKVVKVTKEHSTCVSYHIGRSSGTAKAFPSLVLTEAV